MPERNGRNHDHGAPQNGNGGRARWQVGRRISKQDLATQRARAAEALAKAWREDSRWSSVTRPYAADEVVALRGSIKLDYTLAQHAAARLWQLLTERPYVRTFG